MKNKALFLGAIVLAALASGCSGGGGNSSPSTPVSPIPTGNPTNPPGSGSLSSVSGIVLDGTSNVPLQGTTVSLGTLPNPSTCNAAQTQSVNACGTASAVVASAQTGVNGSFVIPSIATGDYLLTVTKDGSLATLHRKFSVVSGSNALPNVSLLELTASEQSWLAEVNGNRQSISSPMSFGNLVVDEYAQEQAVRWAKDEAAGSIPYTDASYIPYQDAYTASPGAIFTPAGVLALGAGSAYNYTLADSEWFGEKTNCPNGNWQTCTFSSTTGHYINISNTDTVWVGLGESDAANASGYHAYDVMLIENLANAGPA